MDTVTGAIVFDGKYPENGDIEKLHITEIAARGIPYRKSRRIVS